MQNVYKMALWFYSVTGTVAGTVLGALFPAIVTIITTRFEWNDIDDYLIGGLFGAPLGLFSGLVTGVVVGAVTGWLLRWGLRRGMIHLDDRSLYRTGLPTVAIVVGVGTLMTFLALLGLVFGALSFTVSLMIFAAPVAWVCLYIGARWFGRRLLRAHQRWVDDGVQGAN